jgi:hypothetical protein
MAVDALVNGHSRHNRFSHGLTRLVQAWLLYFCVPVELPLVSFITLLRMSVPPQQYVYFNQLV